MVLKIILLSHIGLIPLGLAFFFDWHRMDGYIQFYRPFRSLFKKQIIHNQGPESLLYFLTWSYYCAFLSVMVERFVNWPVDSVVLNVLIDLVSVFLLYYLLVEISRYIIYCIGFRHKKF